jgi:chromosome segregation ATPase
MLRFQEARGRHYEDPASDSSWGPHEVKDLDANQGSHIKPGKLKNAVSAGHIKDLDNYFQVAVVEDEVESLRKQVAALAAQLKGLTGELNKYDLSVREEKGKPADHQDADAIGDLLAKSNDVAKRIDETNKAIAEKQTKLDELVSARAKAAKVKADAEAKEKADAEAKAKADAEAEEKAKADADAAAEEDAKKQKYAELIASGMSEAEAKEEVWPSTQE